MCLYIFKIQVECTVNLTTVLCCCHYCILPIAFYEFMNLLQLPFVRLFFTVRIRVCSRQAILLEYLFEYLFFVVVAALFCDHVVCDSNLFNATCPPDSMPLSTSLTDSEDSCCPPVKHKYDLLKISSALSSSIYLKLNLQCQ